MKPMTRDELIQKRQQAKTTMRQADLTGALLTGTALKNVDLRGVVLDAADLSGVDLSGANIEAAQLLRVISLADAIMPDGKKYTGPDAENEDDET